MTEPEPYYSYGIKITYNGLPDALYWRWQVDLEPGNGVLDFGRGRSRRSCVRQAQRTIRRHARRRGNKMDYWYKDKS